MNRHRVRSFTIMEVITAMLLTTILIGVTFTAYTIINRSYLIYQDKNNSIAAVVRLNNLLEKDFARADTILKTNDGLVFEQDTVKITYKLLPDYIIRHSSIIDTFKIQPAGINMLFEGQAITGAQDGIEQNILDELDLTILLQGVKIPYFYHKHYSSANLEERDQNAFN